MKKKINQHIINHLNLLEKHKNLILNVTLFIAKEIRKTYRRNGKVFLAGNGGSAADCEHIAGELVGRYKKNRKPLSAISLTTDTSVITCIANDFGYDKIFESQFEGNANRNDLLIVMSTSGNSKNIINVLKKAKQKKIMSIAMLGNKGGKCRKVAKHSFIVPSNNTANIQETHHLIGHLVCSVFG